MGIKTWDRELTEVMERIERESRRVGDGDDMDRRGGKRGEAEVDAWELMGGA